jgi:capsular polysaccharide transport system ATP-binding protein
MITLRDVYKRYTVDHVPGKWLLNNVSLSIPPKTCVGVIGGAASGKSTLLRLLVGTERLTAGNIIINGRLTSPERYVRNFQLTLSGRQNAKFIIRINGYADDIDNRLWRVENLAGLGEKFDKAVSIYTPQMKANLSFALSMVFDFDMYITDGFNFAGMSTLQEKGAVDSMFMRLAEKSGLIMTSKGAKTESTLKRYCKSAIWLNEGRAEWFDDINDAFDLYNISQTKVPGKTGENSIASSVTNNAQAALAKIKRMQNFLFVLYEGFNGSPATVSVKQIHRYIKTSKDIDIELLSTEQITALGYQVRAGMMPILKSDAIDGHYADYYDLNTQCDIVIDAKN